MEDKPLIGLRYCGGCNPRYDRVAAAKKLEGLFPGLRFVAAEAGKPYAAVAVICGCPSRCAKVDDLAVPASRMAYISRWSDLLSAKELLDHAQEGVQARRLTHREVLAILPHREPMLFIDEADRLIPGMEVAASFYVSPSLPVFEGHFPGEPVFPGIYAVEAITQAAGLLLLTLDRYAGKAPLFMSIRRANFRKMILPGDTLDIHATLVEDRAELGVVVCRGQILTNGEICADAEVRIALR